MARLRSVSAARLALTAVLLTVPLGACTGSTGGAAGDPSAVSTSAGTASPTGPASASTAASSPAPASVLPSGAAVPGQPVVVLDPGHDGGNAGAPAVISRLVPTGRGQRKPCNTTGTATVGGYPEHAFTWDVAQRVRAILTGHGVTVRLTRDTDAGVGPCVDERAAIGNRAQAAAVVSIHADGDEHAGAHGFHVVYSSPPLNAAQGTPALGLATALRDALRGNGFPTANYLGADGLAGRADLAGLNLSTVPAALVECGNMREPADAAQLTSPDGRQRYATAIAAAVLRWLAR